MPKYHQIKWRESDYEQLGRIVRNFNAKISRISKKNPQMVGILPDKVSLKELKKLINTRQDYRRELNTLQRFLKRGAEQVVEVPNNEYNLKITKWQRTEINRRIAVINRRRKNRLEELTNFEATSRGEKLGYTRGAIGMGRATEISLSPMNAFTRSMSRKDLRMKWLGILRESQSDYFTQKDFRLRENYIKALLENFNPHDIQDVIVEIQDMDIKQFLTKFEEEGGTLELAYPPNREQYEAYLNALKTIWNQTE